MFTELVLEECPKWQALKEVLEEIDGENERMKSECGDTGTVLVVAQDDRTCNQIKEVRTNTEERFPCRTNNLLKLRGVFYMEKQIQLVAKVLYVICVTVRSSINP